MHGPPSDNTQLLSWLARTPSSPDTSPLVIPIQLQYLERLDLGNLRALPELLVGVITKFAPTLCSLSLRRVTLLDSTNAFDSPEKPWVRFFINLSQLKLGIREIELSLLGSTTVALGQRSDVQLGARPAHSRRDRGPHTYKGDATRVLIQRILADLEAGKKVPDEDSSEEESSEDDDSDSDDGPIFLEDGENSDGSDDSDSDGSEMM
jgi:hypothetical protein